MFQPSLHEMYLPEDPKQGREERRIAYTEWGSPDNPNMLLCVHGLTRNSRDFDYLASDLSADFRIICPDIVGRGRSSWLENHDGYDIPYYIADVIALLNKFKPKTLSWVGTSMGGIIAMGFAMTGAYKINKLVLNDIGPFVDHTALRSVAEYVGQAPRFSTLEEAEQYCRQTYQSFGIEHDDDWHYFTKHSFTTDEEGMLVRAFDPAIAKKFASTIEGNDAPDINLWPLWESVTCPTLAIHGAYSTILTEKTLEQMKHTGPPLTIFEVPNAGHAPALMDKDQIKHVHRWLTDVTL